jgi:hypothetical protein
MGNKLHAGTTLPFDLLTLPIFYDTTYKININRLKVVLVVLVVSYFPRVEGFFSLFSSCKKREKMGRIRNVLFFDTTDTTNAIFVANDTDYLKRGGSVKRQKGSVIRLPIAKKGIKCMWLLISVLRQVVSTSIDGGFTQEVVSR